MSLRHVSIPSRAFLLAVTVGCLCACSAVTTPQPSTTGFPDGVPLPVNATVIVGSNGAGYDAGAQAYGFSSDLSPSAALAGYTRALIAAGFAASGSNGPWRVFVGHGRVVEVQVGSSGPPTDLAILVEPQSRHGVPSSPPGQSNPGGSGNAVGQPSSPPGQSNPGGSGNAVGQPSSPPGQSNTPQPVPQPPPPHGTAGP